MKISAIIFSSSLKLRSTHVTSCIEKNRSIVFGLKLAAIPASVLNSCVYAGEETVVCFACSSVSVVAKNVISVYNIL